MATWITHMRIAEHFMENNGEINNPLFLVGNIGPDCGVPNSDWSSFTPDKHMTHCWSKDDTFIDADSFKNQYLKPGDPRYPFYLGYYYHLLTDIEWSKFYDKKKQEPVYAEGLARDKDFIWTIKKDWYGQDHVYLQNHPDSVFFQMFAKIEQFENNYLDFFPENAFIRQIQYITHFYCTATEDPARDFPYLSPDETDRFVQDTIRTIRAVSC